MLHYLTIGVVLGLSAGTAPGPLLALVISETLQHNFRAGIKVALSPIITDLPVVIVSQYLLSKLAEQSMIFEVISLFGSAFLFFLACQGFLIGKTNLEYTDGESNSLFKGILTNSLSPYPYIFWLTVGDPTMTKALSNHFRAAIAFTTGFYVLLVGSKILLAALVAKSRHFLKANGYVYTMRELSVALCLLALLLLADGLKLMNLT